METMNTIALRDESQYPDDEVLNSILNKSFSTYKKLLEIFIKNDMSYEWRYYHDGKAWLCKVQKKNRTIVWMSAWKGHMQAVLYFPEKYIDKVYELNISEAIKDSFHSTKNIGKSKPCIFKISNDRILRDLEMVIILKLECR